MTRSSCAPQLNGPVAQLFGAYTGNLYHSAGEGASLSVVPGAGGTRGPAFAVVGQFADLVIGDGVAEYAFEDGRPSRVERAHAGGSAALLGWSASLQCFSPGAAATEALLAGAVAPGRHAEQPPWGWRVAPSGGPYD